MQSGNATARESRAERDNRLTGQVTREIYLGEIVEYLVAVGGGEILVRTLFGGVAKGDTVTLSFLPEQTIALAQA